MHVRHRIGGYRELTPDPEAARVCEAFWTHYAGERVTPGAAHRVLPDPALSVAFWSDREDDGTVRDGGLILIGPKTRPQLFPLVPGIELTAVRIKLEWVAPVLGIDPGALDNQIVDLGAVRSDLTGRTADRLRRTRCAGEVLSVLTRAILERPASRATPSAAVTGAMDIIRKTAGAVPCQRVAGAVGVSARHLRRRVQDSAGLSPKMYARALRLSHAMQLADRTAVPAWADIAIAAGYCDQSHLIRDTLNLTGLSPAHLHVERQCQMIGQSRA